MNAAGALGRDADLPSLVEPGWLADRYVICTNYAFAFPDVFEVTSRAAHH